MRRIAGPLLVGLTAAAACGRVEEPSSSGGARVASAVPRDVTRSEAVHAREAAEPGAPGAPTAAAPERPSVGDGGSARCVVPLGPPPARKEEPARFCPADPETPPRLPRRTVSFPDAPGAPRVQVEVAREPEHRERGLMYRTTLAEGDGMLFSWTYESVRSFWMRNTCLPLDMLFLAADGTVVGVLEQVPVLNEAPRSVPCPAAHVLEVNAGWVRRHGVAPGQRVELGRW